MGVSLWYGVPDGHEPYRLSRDPLEVGLPPVCMTVIWVLAARCRVLAPLTLDSLATPAFPSQGYMPSGLPPTSWVRRVTYSTPSHPAGEAVSTILQGWALLEGEGGEAGICPSQDWGLQLHPPPHWELEALL